MTSFAILVYDQVEAVDLGATFGVLSMARRLEPTIEMYTVARVAGIVRLANGLEMIAQYGFDNCPAADVLMILGGASWPQQSQDDATLNFIRKFCQEGTVASVCTGGLILAATGLLKGKTVTTRRYAPPGVPTPLSIMRELFPDLNPVEAQVIDNGAIITGGGVMLSADTTLHLIEKYFGEKLAWDVAHLIEYKTAWQANRAEFSTEGRRELARPGHS